jgi:hypothetical protein
MVVCENGGLARSLAVEIAHYLDAETTHHLGVASCWLKNGLLCCWTLVVGKNYDDHCLGCLSSEVELARQ